jgi:hypothetical protein
MATGFSEYPSASELAALIRARELSPVAAVETALARIEEVNPVLNAFAFVYPEKALEAARAAETAVMRGEATGELHGVPIALKDFTPRGQRTTLGSYGYEVPERFSCFSCSQFALRMRMGGASPRTVSPRRHVSRSPAARIQAREA